MTAVMPAHGFVPTRYRLTVNLWRRDKRDWDTLNWIYATEEQLTVLVKYAALTAGERAEAELERGD